MKFKQFIDILEKNEIPKEKRTLNNIPRYSTGKPKINFKDWLGLSGNGSKGYDGKYYGWSHRAIHGFGVGDVIKKGSIGNKYNNADFKPYKIKDEKEAKEHAIRFGKEVS